MIKLQTKIKTRKLDREIADLKKKRASKFLTPWNQDISEILNFAREAGNKFEDVIVIGIGGSILGAKVLFETLKSPYGNFRGKPRMFFVDNLDPNQLLELENICNVKKTLFIITSKSGETLETMSMFSLAMPYLKKELGKKFKEHVVVVTEENEGKLYKIAQKEGLKTFFIPKEIPGRFSVFTPAGLLPAALVGIDIKKLLEGTRKIKLNNIPAKLAHTQYKLNKNATVIFPYANNFKEFTEWYRQLLAESLGKKSTIGPIPIPAIGPKDQHSLLQLLMAGPRDKFVLFIEIQDFGNKHKMGREIQRIVLAEKKATEKLLPQKNATIVLPKIDEEHIGQLLFALECQIALLGELYGINAFNQPGVEKVKKLTKKILGQN